MEGMKLLQGKSTTPLTSCCRCQIVGCPWDRIEGQAFCPDCQEGIMVGSIPPFSLRLEQRRCVVCRKVGVLRYTTFPLHQEMCLEMDLCSSHLQDLMGRRLTTTALQLFELRLELFGLGCKDIFLLHEAFYDDEGQPLQPVLEPID